MNPRTYTFLDRCLSELDSALRTVAAEPRASRPRPDHQIAGDIRADTAANRISARLMRVNHAGEVAAQALYRGQALVARDPELRARLLEAAGEELDHLAWCHSRLAELGDRASWLTPLWFGGSFAIGAVAGLAGDRTSLGFLAETERQVEQHIERHLQELPAEDHRSRKILLQMQADEEAHGRSATEMGGRPLPRPVVAAMKLISRVMTTTARRI
ncbi:MAG: 2-polyprenyl-3-methyl-6-methoxy-1,4-benzoquinone monooxygenase [Gammaproteobacteria bacterium]|jgi:ubiquinone biosynthesis monooxygenase Coq7|nr:2-polyprenyl-3-methyl-6-methoxy-1,4-benzoquinone monooxygenase [Gammaproteobacteria bacterium]